MEFKIPVEFVELRVGSQSFLKIDETLKDKDVKVKISEKKIKLNFSWKHGEEELKVKTLATVEFSFLAKKNIIKALIPNTNKTEFSIKFDIILKNKLNDEQLELYQCLLDVETEINYKTSDYSFIKIKAAAQGDINGKIYDFTKAAAKP